MYAPRFNDVRAFAVRIESGFMEPTEVNANRFAQLSGGPMSLEEDE